MSESPAFRAFADKLARYAYNAGIAASESPDRGRSVSSRRRARSPRAVPPASPAAPRRPPGRSASQAARKRIRVDHKEVNGLESGEHMSSESDWSDAGSDYRAPSTESKDDDPEDDTKPDLVDEAESTTPSKRARSKIRVKSDPAAPASLASPVSTPRSKSKNGKKPRPFASPEVYQHLRPVQDILQPDLDIVFCGINPGQRSSTAGHHFAHPTNKFWRALHLSGLTNRLHPPSEDQTLPALYNYGLTNLCDRPTAEQSELSTLELRLSVLQLSRKIQRERPRIVCFVGKKIWDIYESVAGKTARTADVPDNGTSTTPQIAIKSEEDVNSDPNSPQAIVGLSVKEEPDDPPMTPIATSKTAPKPGTSRPAGSQTTKAAEFDWTQPRRLRLPFLQDGPGNPLGYTYFWVVPNTSGLERTPLAQQVVLFGHLRNFLQTLKAGPAPTQQFQDIDILGVEQTVAALRLAAETKSRR